jgi:hypothetical protein
MPTLPPNLDHPAVAVKCSACPTFKEHVAQCEEIKCCFAYQRRGHEQRVKDDAKITEERARRDEKDARVQRDRLSPLDTP